MIRALRAAAVTALGFALGCAATPSTVVYAPDHEAGDVRPWSPRASSDARTGGPVGATPSGREDEARRTVARFLEALEARDAQTLLSMFPAEGVRAQDRVVPRAAATDDLLRVADSIGLGSTTHAGDLFDVVRVGPARDLYVGRMTAGIEATDLAVTLRPRTMPRNAQVQSLFFPGTIAALLVVVRLDPEPAVLAVR